MNYLTSIAALLVACGALVFVTFHSRRRIVDDRQPWPEERLAWWEQRRAAAKAEERLREARVAQAFDARANVHPVLDPRRLP